MSPRKARRGGSAVEFGMTLPVLQIVLVAGLEYGWYYTQLAWLQHAARDAVRYAVTLDPEEYDVSAQATTRAEEQLDAYGLPCAGCVDASTYQADGFDALTVAVETDYTALVNMVPVPEKLRSEATMMLMYQSSGP